MSIARFMQMAANTGEDIDPYFNQTTLLLHGDGTNGAQNNTFLDSSTNNFTITRNGNTTQGTFSPFSAPDGRWSNFFDGGASTRLTFADSADWIFSGDFTVDFWFYTTELQASPGGAMIAQWVDGGGSNRNFSIFHKNDGTVGAGVNRSGTNYDLISSAVATNEWVYCCFTLNGTTLSLYINGVLEDSMTVAGSANNSGESLGIGAYGNDDYPYKGYLANVRIINGTALSGAIPTDPFPTNTTNQKLLTCYGNRFADFNTATTAKTITVNGTPSVQPFSPFAPSAAYSPSVNGGSGYFDGSGDSLSITDVSSLLDFGTGAFTVSLWFYKTTTTNNVAIYDARDTGSNTGWLLANDASDTLTFYVLPNSMTGTTVIKPNQWYYVHVSRSGTTISMYLNGVLEASFTESGNVNCDGIVFGAKRYPPSGFGEFPGYLSSINIVSGTATSNAVPSAPTTGGTFLANFSNAGIFDNTGKNNLETVGNAQIDTTTKKYGTGSMEFDGTGDVLKLPLSPNLDFGTGDFTIECWAYITNLSPGYNPTLIARWQSGSNLYTFQILAGGTFRFITAAGTWTGGSISVNTWTHLAVSRSGTNLRLFNNGVLESTNTDSTSLTSATQITSIGGEGDAAQSTPGFIDDVRITKGVARYTTNFTPPSRAFPNL